MRISDGAQVGKLASNVINYAIRDLLFGNPVEQILALEFLVSRDFDLWSEAAGVELNPRIVLREPDRVRKLLRTKKETGNERKKQKRGV